MCCRQALDPNYVATHVSVRLPGNEISDQRALLIQLPATHQCLFFETQCILQATSNNFLFYDHQSGEIMPYPYLIYEECSHELVPVEKLKDYHQSHRQNYECWCGQCSLEHSCFVDIYSRGGYWFYGCEVCSLHVCINDIYETATEHAVYLGYPKSGAILPVPVDPMVQATTQHTIGHGSGPLGLQATRHNQRKQSSIGSSMSKLKNYIIPTWTGASSSSFSPPSSSALICHKDSCRCTQTPIKVEEDSDHSVLHTPSSSVLEGCMQAPSVPVAGPSNAQSSAGPSSASIVSFEDVTIHCSRCKRWVEFDSWEDHFCLPALSPEL
ncbi:hypothetical protein M422DRAFT_247552 [Sphaerobolus stellatus SS14]|nr:hypothetical protein M422DRAFT_247552 [Sphaerobolus stellatus SS14]